MTSKQIIERVLEKYPQTRNSDKKLILAVWAIQGLHLSESQKQAFYKASDPDSIKRHRRTIQNSLGKYQASEKVSKYRQDKFNEHRQVAAIDPKEMRLFDE